MLFVILFLGGGLGAYLTIWLHMRRTKIEIEQANKEITALEQTIKDMLEKKKQDEAEIRAPIR